MTYEVEIGGRTARVEIAAHPAGGYVVRVDGGPERHVHAGALGAAERWLADERGRRTVALHLDGEVLTAQLHGHGLTGKVVDPRQRALASDGGSGEGTIRTPMPGAVARVLVGVGDAVHKGQVLVVVEAMKMENEFRSPVDGVVREVPAVAGTSVDGNTVLVVVEPGGVA